MLGELDFFLATRFSWGLLLTLLLAWGLVVPLPGLLLSWVLYPGRRISWVLRLPVALGLGIAQAVILGTLVLAMDWQLGVLLWLIIGLQVILMAVLVLRPRPDQQPEGPTLPTNTLLLVFFALATVLILGRFLLPMERTVTAGDFWSYLVFVRKWATWGERPVGNLFHGRVENGVTGFRHLTGGWMLLQSLVAMLSGVDAVDVAAWWFPAWLSVAAYIATYGFAETLFRNRNAAMLATLVQVIQWSLAPYKGRLNGIGYSFFYRLNEDKFVLSFVIVPLALLFALRFLRRKRWPDLLGWFALALTAALLHPMGLVELGLLMGFFGLLQLVFAHDRETILRLGLVLGLLALLLVIPLLQRRTTSKPFAVAGEQSQEIFQGLHQERLLLVDAKRNLYMSHPRMLDGWVTGLALILTPALLLLVRRDLGARYCFATMAGLVLILYNPLLAPVLGKIITPWMLWRLIYLLPSALLLGFWLERLLRWAVAQVGPRRQELVALIPVALVAIAALYLHIQGILFLPPLLRENKFLDEFDVLIRMRDLMDDPTMVMAEHGARIGRYIPALIQEAYVPAWRKLEFQEGALDRVASFYEGDWIESEDWQTLLDYGCQYLIVNAPRLPKYEALLPLLEPVYWNGHYILFAVTPAPADHPLIQANVWFAQGAWTEAGNAYAALRNAYPALASWRLGQSRARLGDREGARAALEAAVAVAPEAPGPFVDLADLERLEGEPAQALLHYRDALAQTVSYPWSSPALLRSLNLINARGLPGLTLAPTLERTRWGTGSVGYTAHRVQLGAELGVGWFTNWELLPEEVSADTLPLEVVQVVSLSHGRTVPYDGQLNSAVWRHPGGIWLVGMAPETPWGGDNTPADYAQAYHHVYHFVKSRDRSMSVLAGGILQPTPLRLQWLSQVMTTYKRMYGEPLPADGWHLGVYALPERPGVSGGRVPAGLPSWRGLAYRPGDSLDDQLFRTHVLAFRRWMAAHGQRERPLLISGYGLPEWAGHPVSLDVAVSPANVCAFMEATSDWLIQARDPQLGYPADDNRLVQRWVWGRLAAPGEDETPGVLYRWDGTLLGLTWPKPPWYELTFSGACFAAYLAQLPTP